MMRLLQVWDHIATRVKMCDTGVEMKVRVLALLRGEKIRGCLSACATCVSAVSTYAWCFWDRICVQIVVNIPPHPGAPIKSRHPTYE